MTDDVNSAPLTRRPATRTLWAVVVAMIYPTLLTLAYFVWLGDGATGLQQTVFGIGKVIQFVFPAVWVLVVLRERFSFRRPDANGLLVGGIVGLAIMAAMLGLYHWVLLPWGTFDGPATAIRAKVAGFGITTGFQFFLFGTFYAVCHSALEEYYWRWFVFGRLADYVSQWSAIVISSVAFAAHHVILLATFFGWDSPLAYFFSLCVAIGGGLWAWIYAARKSFYGIWLSHGLVDAAIFLVGYDVL